MRELDVVVFGASGFTGQLIAEHLHRHHVGTGALRLGLAGRSAEKLREVSEALGPDADISVLVADVDNEASLVSMCRRTKVVLNAAGPYQQFGTPVVRACVQTGTDYVDLAGEVLWVRDMMIAFEDEARTSGARLLPVAGFESVPFDLAVQMAQDRAIAEYGAPLQRVKCRFRDLHGMSASSGSRASGKGMMTRIANDPEAEKNWNDPFSLARGFTGAVQPSEEGVQYDPAVSAWVYPFLTSRINSKIVHRSNQLLGTRWGPGFQYDEMKVGEDGEDGRMAAIEAMASPLSQVATRQLTAEEREAGGYDILFIGEMADGRRVDVKVTGDRDLGYGSTSKIIAETAACLAATPKSEGGFFTTAALMGDTLRGRLVQYAGLTFDLT